MEYRDSSDLKAKFETKEEIPLTGMNAIGAKIVWCMERAKEAGLAVDGMKSIYVRGSLHGGSTAGRAAHKRDGHYISVHPSLIAKHGQAYIDKTVVHEVAHCIQKHIWPRSRAHGSEWHHVMHILGIEYPERCSNWEGMERVRMARPYIYTCACREHPLTHILHNRILQGKWRKCLRCKQRLAFKRVA